MVITLLDMAVATAETDVRYMADLVSDGTSNNVILTAVRMIVAIVQVVLIGVFAINVAKHAIADGKDWKANFNEMKGLAFAEGALAVVWGLAELGARVFEGTLQV